MMNKKQEIYYVSSIAGGGKTYSAVDYAAGLAKYNKKVIFCQPTKELIKKTVQDLCNRFPQIKCTAIYSLDDKTPVVPEIIAHIESANNDEKGEVLFITHAALSRINFFQNKKNWYLIYDEIPQVDWSQQFRLAEHKEMFCDLFKAMPFVENSEYMQLVGENSKLDEITQNSRTDVFWEYLQQLTARLRSDDQLVLVKIDSLKDFLEEKTNDVNIHSLLQPTFFDGFAETTIMGAGFTDSIMYKAWEKTVDFIVNPKIKPRYSQHNNGNLVEIFYAHEAKWSKNVRDKIINDKKVLEHDLTRVNDLFKNESSIYMCNLDNDLEIAQKLNNGTKLPNSPHGLNDFMNFDNVVVFSALNPSNAHFGFLEEICNINSQETADAIYRQQVYQAVLRGSIRDQNSTTNKRVVVMDKISADWLSDLLPNSKISPLNGEDLVPTGRSRMYDSNNEKQKAFQKKKKATLLQNLIDINNPLNEFNENNFIQNTVLPFKVQAFITYDYKDKLTGDIKSTFSNKPFYTEEMKSNNDFVSWLKELSKIKYKNKMDAPLISPAVFDAKLSPDKKKRGLGNIKYLRNIWLDNDGHELYGNGISPEDFAKIFPNIRIFAFNSYGNSAERQKYRVMIPTKQRMTPEIYKFVIAEIMMKLTRENGEILKYLKNLEIQNTFISLMVLMWVNLHQVLFFMHHKWRRQV